MPQPKYLAIYVLAFVLLVAIVSSIPKLTKSYLSGQDVDTRLLVGTTVWSGYEPLFLAQSLGKLPPERIRLVEYASSSQVARALANDVVDAATVTLDEALRIAALGTSIDVVLVMDVSAGGDVILAWPEFGDMQSLTGKRVGLESTALGAFVLQRALSMHGMTSDDVDVVPLEIDEHEAAALERRVDAVITFNPVAGRLRSAGLVELFSSNDIPGEIVDVLVVRSDRLAEQIRALTQLTDAWFEALAYLEEEPADAHQRMTPRLGTDVAVIANEIGMLHFPSRAENLKFLGEERELDLVIEKILPVLRNFDDVQLDGSDYDLANPVLLERTVF